MLLTCPISLPKTILSHTQTLNIVLNFSAVIWSLPYILYLGTTPQYTSLEVKASWTSQLQRLKTLEGNVMLRFSKAKTRQAG